MLRDWDASFSFLESLLCQHMCMCVCVTSKGVVLHLFVVPVPVSVCSLLVDWSQTVALDSVLFQGDLGNAGNFADPRKGCSENFRAFITSASSLVVKNDISWMIVKWRSGSSEQQKTEV